MQTNLRLRFESIEVFYVYCFVLYPFDKNEYKDKPWRSVKQPEAFPIPAIVPSYEEWELESGTGTVRFKKGERQRCGRYEVKVTVEETGWGIWRLTMQFLEDLGDVDVDTIWALVRLGALPNLSEQGIILKLTPYYYYVNGPNGPIAKGIRIAHGKDGQVKRLDALFEHITEQILRKYNLFNIWVEKKGLPSMISEVTGREGSRCFLLINRSSESPKYSPGVAIALKVSPQDDPQDLVQYLEGDIENTIRIALGIKRTKTGDERALAQRAGIVEKEGNNWKLVNWMPVKDYVLLLHPGKAVAFCANDSLWEEVLGTLDEIQDLNVSWYVHALAGIWIDKRLQEIPSLKREIEKALDEARDDIGRRALNIQKKLVEVVIREKSMLARVFEEPIHHKLSFGGMQPICQYYLEVMGLQRLWDVCFQKLNVLGRLYDELMDYVRLRDAEFIEQQLGKQRREAARSGFWR
jgi:hypothetical protein